MNTLIMWVMACGAVLGGLDRILGNRFGLGKRFEEGFELLGATALSMAGIICLVPLLTLGLEKTIVPFWKLLGLDPAMLGGIIAIDMGGFQLAVELAADPKVVSYAGILVAATLGCTVTFTIPVGMGMVPGKRPAPLCKRHPFWPDSASGIPLSWRPSDRPDAAEHDPSKPSGVPGLPCSGPWHCKMAGPACRGLPSFFQCDPPDFHAGTDLWGLRLYDRRKPSLSDDAP